jgi:hypothetical protein
MLVYHRVTIEYGVPYQHTAQVSPPIPFSGSSEGQEAIFSVRVQLCNIQGFTWRLKRGSHRMDSPDTLW